MTWIRDAHVYVEHCCYDGVHAFDDYWSYGVGRRLSSSPSSLGFDDEPSRPSCGDGGNQC